MLSIFLFQKYLFSKRAGSLIRLISWISLFGVAIGVLSLIVVVSVMSGFHQVIRSRLIGLEPHVVATFLPATPEATMTQNLATIRNTAPNADEVVRVESQDLIIRTLDGVFSGGLARGYQASDLENFSKRLEDLGRQTQLREERAKKHPVEIEGSADFSPGLHAGEKEIILGIDLAQSLGILEGDQVLLIPPEGLLVPKGEMPIYEKATVVGRVSTRVADMDSKLILYDRNKSLLRMSNSPSREKSVEIRLKDPSQSDALKARLVKMFPQARVESWQDRNEALFFALRMEKLVMTIFLGLSGLITSFSIVSVLSLLISQKRKEIGLMMAMGLTSHRVQKIFVGVGFLLSSLGIVLGLILGVLVCALIDRFPVALLPDIYYDSTIPVLISTSAIGIIAVTAFAIATVSAYLPSRSLSSLTPAETFRRI